jgi:DNA transformation protein and related proteins
MSRPISSLRNLGPVMERQLREVGIGDAEELSTTGAVEAYIRLRLMSPNPISLIALYAMHAALLGCDWRSLSQKEKATLRRLVDQ